MTTDALVTSNNAISFSHAVENTEREDKERIEDVSTSHHVRTAHQSIANYLYAWKYLSLLEFVLRWVSAVL